LTQRQQRRALRQPPTIATIDSWDFASTTHSPSLLRQQQIGDLLMTTSEQEISNDESSNPQQDNYFPLFTSASNGNTSTDVAAEGLSIPPTNPSSFSESPTNSKLSEPGPTYPTCPPRNEDIIKGSFWSRLSSGAKRPSILKVMVGNSKCSGDNGRSPLISAQGVGLQLSESPDKNQEKGVMKDLVSETIDTDREFKSGSHSWSAINNR